jgi:hypothetical protein
VNKLMMTLVMNGVDRSVTWQHDDVLLYYTCTYMGSGFKYINQPDATISRVYYLTFMYSSTCFRHPHAHHQELNNCSSSLWFYHWRMVVAVLLVMFGPTGPTNSTAITTLQRWNQRLLLQLLSSWWWVWGCPKHVSCT